MKWLDEVKRAALEVIDAAVDAAVEVEACRAFVSSLGTSASPAAIEDAEDAGNSVREFHANRRR